MLTYITSLIIFLCSIYVPQKAFQNTKGNMHICHAYLYIKLRISVRKYIDICRNVFWYYQRCNNDLKKSCSDMLFCFMLQNSHNLFRKFYGKKQRCAEIRQILLKPVHKEMGFRGRKRYVTRMCKSKFASILLILNRIFLVNEL